MSTAVQGAALEAANAGAVASEGSPGPFDSLAKGLEAALTVRTPRHSVYYPVADCSGIMLSRVRGVPLDHKNFAPAHLQCPYESHCSRKDALQLIDGGLEQLSVPYSYGFSIILLTLLVKVATFPLTQKQVCPKCCHETTARLIRHSSGYQLHVVSLYIPGCSISFSTTTAVAHCYLQQQLQY